MQRKTVFYVIRRNAGISTFKMDLGFSMNINHVIMYVSKLGYPNRKFMDARSLRD